MVFLTLFKFSGIQTEQGHPVGLESITDLYSCHVDTHNNRVLRVGVTPVKLLLESMLHCKSA
jgi:hypothetical protein